MIHIGFDIGGTSIKSGVISEDARLLTDRIVPFPGRDNHMKTIDVLEDLAKDMTSELGYTMDQVGSIGIASPGSIDIKTGVVLHAYNLGFSDTPLIASMQKRFPHIPMTLLNDADAATFGEYKAGALKNHQTAVLLTLGTGVGGGLIINGQLFPGGMKHGTEPGHMIIDRKGDSCTCGNRGCAEIYCNASWLAHTCGEANAKAVFDRANAGDPKAVHAVDEYAQNLSILISNITNLLDPEIIALGGGVSQAGNILYEPLKQYVYEKSFFKHQYQVVPAKLGNKAGIIGAGMLGASLI